jgi:hypothetical protein
MWPLLADTIMRLPSHEVYDHTPGESGPHDPAPQVRWTTY